MNSEKLTNISRKLLAVVLFLLGIVFALIGKVGAAVFFVILAFVCFFVKIKPKQPAKSTASSASDVADQNNDLERYEYLTFPVAGVTFKNDDGSSRQKILKRLCDGEDYGVDSVDFEEYVYNGEPAIYVLTDEGCIGNIRRTDVKKVKKIIHSPPLKALVNIDTFEDEDEKQIFRADVQITMDRENPNHQWFFNEV